MDAIVKTARAEYEASKGVLEQAKSYLVRLEAKKGGLDERLSALVAELGVQKAEVKKKMGLFVADAIGEEDLAAAQAEVDKLERQVLTAKSLPEAVADEIEQAISAVKERSEEVKRAHMKLWELVGRAELARAREIGQAAIKRAYLARRRSATAGLCPPLHEFIEAEVFRALPLTAGDEAALFSELEREYGVSRT